MPEDDAIPEADAAEQHQAVADEPELASEVHPDRGLEVPEADAVEQAISVPYDDEEVR